MLVTLITDASFCPETKAAGWAAWVGSHRGHARKSGIIPTRVGNNNEAEMRAIVFGLRFALEQRILFKGDGLIVKTDSHHARHKLEPMYSTPHGRLRLNQVGVKRVPVINGSSRSEFAVLVSSHEIICLFEAIEGHTSVRDRDSHDVIMAWADKKSRKHMRQEQARLRDLCPGK